MHILEQAKAAAAERRADADHIKADLLQRLNDVIKRERDAAFLEGVVYGVEHGLAGLSQAISDTPSAPTGVAADHKETEADVGDQSKRRPPGANEALILRIVGNNAESGIAARELIEEARRQEGIADSSARVALGRLSKKGEIVEIDGKFFPNAPAEVWKPEAPNVFE
jgi:hypothetical protein